MRKIVFIFAMLMATLTIKAQYEEGDILIQPRVGVTISNVTDGDKSNYDTDGSQYDDTIMNLYYGAIPITANYYILPGLALKAGIQPAFRVKANIQHGNEKLDFDKMLSLLFPGEDVKMNTFDLSFPVGLSFEYNRVTIDARYNIGVTKLLSGSTDAIHNKVFAITLGYKFSL